MPRPTQWEMFGQVVTRADVRRWCQSVGSRVAPRNHWQYVRDWGVIEKIARAKQRGVFEETVDQAAAYSGVTVRKPRNPGVLARCRVLLASNDPRF